MSAILITGVPSSGKTYFASKLMLEVYEKKNRPIFTNINLKIKHDEYIHLLQVDELYQFASDELALFKKFTKLSKEYKLKKDAEEDILLVDDEDTHEKESDPFEQYFGNYDKYLKDSGLLHKFGGSVIYWDECHNDLGDLTPDPVWIRFFSYHRHFDMDIVLITQDLSLIHRKYKPFISKFYFGMNPAKRLLSKTLKFKIYTDHRQYEKFYIETISVPMEKKVHNFYDSGQYEVEKSVFIKKMAPIAALIIALVLGYFLFINKGVKESTQDNVTPELTQRDVNESDIKHHDEDDEDDEKLFERDDNDHILFFTCNLELCTLKDSSFIIPLDDIKKFADAVNMEILYSSKINTYYKLVAVNVNESLYNDLMTFKLEKRGDKHEKGRMDFRNNTAFKH